ncbi:hypothetical protein FDK32_21170 [Citrobacter freundii]|uniref:hypothetical protein n=1 Tax=Citrobacter freundii TaxID=546 RepID=UPI001BA88665|nr:hypothetical protein [Citrobacter freundii]MBQ5150373.1 hypothetical protein [Citrobacter freundii]
MAIKMTGCTFSGNELNFVTTSKMSILCNKCGHREIIEPGAFNGGRIQCPECDSDSVTITEPQKEEK